MKRYFELIDDNSSKFWEISTSRTEIKVRYGTIGTAGRASVKDGLSLAEVKLQAEKLITQKTTKGYIEKKVGQSSAIISKSVSSRTFVLEPEWQKCVTLVEFWRNGDLVIERAQLWRFGSVTVEGVSDSDLRAALKKRDEQDRICLSEVFVHLTDQNLKDCISDDLFYPEDMPDKESKRLRKILCKDPEEGFEKEGWQIEETKLYFEAQVNIRAI
jgi:predicted DNA-binding WGR domain protein